MRTPAGRLMASSVISKPALTSVPGLTRASKFVSAVWITEDWCSRCIVAPAPRANITYNCTPRTVPVASGDICAFTCDNADEVPVPGTEPICVISGLKKTIWAVGANGTAACEPAPAAGCTTAPDSTDPNVVFDACTDGVVGDVCSFTCVDPLVALTGTVGPTCDGTDWIPAGGDAAACVECNDGDNTPCTSPNVCVNNVCVAP